MWFDKLTTNGENIVEIRPQKIYPFVLSLSKDKKNRSSKK